MQFIEGGEADYNEGFKVQGGDPYGERCFTYAKDWAELMEKQMAEGKKVHEVADKTSHEADTDGITGYMYGVAVSILARCWAHGEELCKWHNGEYGQLESKGVVNPAVLNVNVPEGADVEEVIKDAARKCGMTPLDDLVEQ